MRSASESERRRAHPVRNRSAIYNEVFVRLIVAGLVFATISFAAAYFYLVPLGPHSPRAVLPVLTEFMTAGAELDAVRAHSLYSSNALRHLPIEEVRRLHARRELFEGVGRIQIEKTAFVPGAEVGGLDRAQVQASITYLPSGVRYLVAELELEPGGWRILRLEFRSQAP